MKLTLTLALVVALLVPSWALAQAPARPVGMAWYFLESAQKLDIEWDAAVADRDKAFAELEAKVKEGDENKIAVYLTKAYRASSHLGLTWARGTDYVRNLEQDAGRAFKSSTSDSFSMEGKMTETEYDKAIALAKSLGKKLEAKTPTSVQKKTWDAAVIATGADAEFYNLDKV